MYILPIFRSLHENGFQLHLCTQYTNSSILCVVICLSIFYYVYNKVLKGFWERTKIPKLYKIKALHSLWMGSMHLIMSVMCFSQLCTLLHPLISEEPQQPFFLKEMLYAGTANFCHESTVHNGSNSNLSNNTLGPIREIPERSTLNTITIIILSAVLIQEILLATRKKMDHIFYSRLLGLIFVTSAARIRCPILSIQGAYLMSINTSSKEIASALVAWKPYSQEDSDHRPSPVMKAVTFAFFVIHMIIWSAMMLFYMPFFIHKLPSITESDANRFFLAYAYLSFLAYIVLEAATSPLWTTIRCMAWCRRSSGLTWRILALSDCHLLGHYSPLVLELYEIQVLLDQRKAMFRNKMVQKHLASIEGRKRKSASDPQARRPPSFLATLKTVVALKKKIQRRMEEAPARLASLEDVSQVDSNVEGNDMDEEEGTVVPSSESMQDIGGIPKIESEENPEVSDKKEETI